MLSLVALRRDFHVEHEDRDESGYTLFICLRPDATSKIEVSIGVLQPRTDASKAIELLIAMNWVSKSAPPAINASREFAEKIESILKEYGAISSYAAVRNYRFSLPKSSS